MKLSQRERALVRDRMQAEPMPDDHPALPHLRTFIGNHTFYVGSEGVFIWEYADDEDGGGGGRLSALRVATWASPGKGTVAMHKPQLTKTVITLSEHPPAEDQGPGDGLPEDTPAKDETAKNGTDPAA